MICYIWRVDGEQSQQTTNYIHISWHYHQQGASFIMIFFFWVNFSKIFLIYFSIIMLINFGSVRFIRNDGACWHLEEDIEAKSTYLLTNGVCFMWAWKTKLWFIFSFNTNLQSTFFWYSCPIQLNNQWHTEVHGDFQDCWKESGTYLISSPRWLWEKCTYSGVFGNAGIRTHMRVVYIYGLIEHGWKGLWLGCL